MKVVMIAGIVAVAAVGGAAVSAQGPNLPKSFVSECEYFVGDWETSVERDGKTYSGIWSVRWSRDKACIVSFYKARSPEGPVSGTRIHGWDASAKELVVVDFAGDGASSVERYKMLNDRIDEGEIVMIDAEGNKSEATARTDRMEKDRFTWTVTKEGEATVYTFIRKPSSAKKEPRKSD